MIENGLKNTNSMATIIQVLECQRRFPTKAYKVVAMISATCNHSSRSGKPLFQGRAIDPSIAPMISENVKEGARGTAAISGYSTTARAAGAK